ncbi:MAG: DUF6941 family protein [Acidobacteriota bacterium]
MKLHTEIITLCDYALISREGKLSINGIFDELRVKKFPGGIARAFFVATLRGKPDTSYQLQMKVEQSGQVKATMNLEIHTSPNGKNNIVTELVNLGFEQAGDCKFAIYHGEDEVGATQLKVMNADEAPKPVSYKLPN